MSKEEMEKRMQVHYTSIRDYPDCPKEIPMGLLNEDWAQKIHGQSLDRLNERGGLAVDEMILNIRRLPYNDIYKLKELECIAELKKLLTS